MISFIRPSRRGWYVALNALIWYLVARINQNLIALILAWGSLALLASSFLMAFFSLRKFRLSRTAVPDAQVGKLLNLPIKCQNLSWRSRESCLIIEALPFAPEEDETVLCPSLKGHETYLLQRTVMPVRRGEFKLKDLALRGADPAGLFLRERAFRLPDTVIVYPHSFPIDHLYLPPQETFYVSSTDTPIAASGNSQEFYGVREYHPSDGMKYIHWKSSAKHNKFMVREFQRATALSVLVLVDANERDLTPKGGANLETEISLAASICKFLASINCTLAFAAGGDQVYLQPPQDSTAAIPNIMYQLAVLKPGKVPLNQAMDAIYPSLRDNALVFCLSLTDRPEIKESLATMAQQGAHIRWYLTDAEDFLLHETSVPHQPTIDDGALVPLRITPDMTPDDIFPA